MAMLETATSGQTAHPPPHYRAHPDPRSSHQQVARVVRALGRGPVLDVGAAQGTLGQLLADAGLTIDGVEMNPHWATLARPFYRTMYVSPIESAELAPQGYAAIVCADILEHTSDPPGVLRKLQCAAQPGATFVISVPNVAHVAIRLMLLFGRFPKMPRGPLDRTHLQFWTRDTAMQLLQGAGLKVTAVSAAGVPLDELWPRGQGSVLFRIATTMQHLLLTALPRLFAQQWIFTAELQQ